MTRLDPTLRALLVCPSCRGELREAPTGLICDPCQLCYPVRDGVPWMVPERALPLSELPAESPPS